MIKKNRVYIVVTGVIAITLIWLSQSNRNREIKLELPTKGNLSENTVDEPVKTFEGILWPSDYEPKGNLMLVGKYVTIYLKTSRDFNDLVGKSVIATVDGTSDNFTLINIEENLTKDGFIEVQ